MYSLFSFVVSLVASVISLMAPALSFAAETQGLQIQRVERYKEVDQVYGSVDRIAVVLNDGRRMKVPLYSASAIKVLVAPDGSLFLLVRGSDCTMCDEGASLRLMPIGPNGLAEAKERYDYPGRLIDHETDKLIQKTRVFYGRCADEAGDVVVWFADYIGDDSKWHKQNAIARLSRKGETFEKDVKLSLAGVQSSVAARRCTELPGVKQTTEP